tara:strand:+ start:380 stop:511 length:132 start_codon:yes stop_codon:yes gene_type:complete
METEHLLAYITWINRNYVSFPYWQARKQQALLELSERTQVVIF